MKLVLFFAILVQATTASATNKGLGDMTPEMWKIILKRPLSFVGVQKAVKTANNVSESFCGVVDEPRHTRDEVDAVRHFILASVMSRLVDKKFTLEFLTAHEQRSDSYNDENYMDLKNNNLGIAFSDKLKSIPLSKIVAVIKKELKIRLRAGTLYVLSTERSECANSTVFPNM